MEWTNTSENREFSALRVVQLDGAILDQELSNLLEAQLKQVFKNFQVNVIRWLPEVNLVLRFIIWKFTVCKSSSTIGQSLFDARYALLKGNAYLPISSKEKFFLGLSYFGMPWLQQRMHYILTCFDFRGDLSEKFGFILKWLESFWKLASVLNFIVFLNKGTYPSLLERLLCLRHVHNRPQIMKKTNFKFMNREILWHGYAEFVFFVLPLINVNKLKSILRRVIGKGFSESPAKAKISSRGSLSDFCPVCNASPTQPYVSQCGHLFCYICIKSSCIDDPSFQCPLCHVQIGHNSTPHRPIR